MDTANLSATELFKLTYLVRLYYTSTCALLVYDCSLTLTHEVRLIRSGGLNAAALCLFNRAAITAWTVSVFIWTLPETDQKQCNMKIIFCGISMLMLYVSWALLSTLRVYAVSRSNPLLTGATFFFGIAPIWIYAVLGKSMKARIMLIPLVNICGGGNAVGRAGILGEALALRFSAIILDGIVLGSTWCYTYSTRYKLSNIPLIIFTMLRDGTLYFLLMFGANCASVIVVWCKGGTMDRWADDNLLMMFDGTFMNPYMGIMVSHFLLNLSHSYEANKYRCESDRLIAVQSWEYTRPQSHLSTIQFSAQPVDS